MSTKEAQFVDFDGLRIEYDARVLAPRAVDGGPVALGRGAKFEVRGYHRCFVCGRPRAPTCGGSRCAASASGSARSWASCRASRSRAGREPMNISDPIADMLTRVRNASRARHTEVVVPASRTKREIARILKDEGFIADVTRGAGRARRSSCALTLKYVDGKVPVVSGLKRISKPGLRVYARKTDIPRVLGGLGIVIVSTSQGIMTARRLARPSSAAKSWPTSGRSRCHVSVACPSPSRPGSMSPSTAGGLYREGPQGGAQP